VTYLQDVNRSSLLVQAGPPVPQAGPRESPVPGRVPSKCTLGAQDSWLHANLFVAHGVGSKEQDLVSGWG
jgi:hypothetical protein